MRLLVLGGTRFLGRALVDAALARNHEVTLFNRGQTNPELFPDVERLVGDRAGDLAPLRGRTFDAVVDTSGYLPRDVAASCRVLAEAGRYCFVSSVSVYADLSVPVDEESAVAELGGLSADEVTDESYGALKALCEQAVRRGASESARSWCGPGSSPARTIRPAGSRTGHIASPAAARCSPPRRPSARLQSIDVRDLGSWIVERPASVRRGGDFNATHPGFTWADLLDACCEAGGASAEVAWVPSGLLAEQGVGEWMELPLWVAIPRTSGSTGSTSAAPSRRARAPAARRDSARRTRRKPRDPRRASVSQRSARRSSSRTWHGRG